MTTYRTLFNIIVPGEPGSRSQRYEFPAEDDAAAAAEIRRYATDMEACCARAGKKEVWQAPGFERIDMPEQTTYFRLGDFPE